MDEISFLWIRGLDFWSYQRKNNALRCDVASILKFQQLKLVYSTTRSVQKKPLSLKNKDGYPSPSHIALTIASEGLEVSGSPEGNRSITDNPFSWPISMKRSPTSGSNARIGLVVWGKNLDPKLHIFKCDGGIFSLGIGIDGVSGSSKQYDGGS